MPLVGQKGGEAQTKATHRWKHIGRGNDKGLSPLHQGEERKVIFRDRKQEKNQIINRKVAIENLIGLGSSLSAQKTKAPKLPSIKHKSSN